MNEYYYIIKIGLNIAIIISIPQLFIMAHQKLIHPEKHKKIWRVAKWLIYQMFSCSMILGFVIKLDW